MKQNKNTKKKQVLKMIADGLFSSHESLMKRYSEIPDDERDNNSWWYLHGQLEQDVNFDKATTVNCKSAGYSKETVNWREILGINVTVVDPRKENIYKMHVNGEVPVEIEGMSKPCIGFFWTTEREDIVWDGKKYPHWEQRGLVCYADDTEGCDYAREKMDERSSFI